MALAAVALATFPAVAHADAAVQGEALTLHPARAGRVVTDSTSLNGSAKKVLGNSYGVRSAVTDQTTAKLILRARGQRCKGAPKVVVSVDNVARMKAAVNTTNYANYSADLTLPTGTHRVKVSYKNDFRTRFCDRNVFIDRVLLETTSPPAPATPVSASRPVQARAPVAAAPAAPAAPPGPVPGRLIAAASFENTTSEVNLQQAVAGRIAPVTSSAVHGNYSMHFQVQNGDRWSQDGGKNRSEALIEPQRGYNPKEGDDYWHRWWFLVPASTPMPQTNSDSIHITQTNSSDNREHMAGFTFRKGALTFDNVGGNLWTLPLPQFQRDRWYKVLWHSHTSTDAAKGYDELWINDVKVGSLNAKTLSSTGNYMKFGLYRIDTGQGTADIYYDGLRVATTREMAEAG